MSKTEDASMSGTRPSVGRRLAAALAVVALLGALVAVGVAIIDATWRLPVVLLAVGAAIVGLWYALSRRGLASVLGGLVAAVGLVVAGLTTFTGDYRGTLLVAVVVLMIVSAWAARYALGRDPRSLHDAALGGPGVGPARRPVLIMNPKSGGGKAERFQLADECRARGIRPVVLAAGDDLRQLATDAIAGGADVIGMAGGDGSQALVATVAAEHDVPFVCIPAGTRNHFALDLGIDREDVVGALDAFAEAVERRVDLARVNGRVFVNNAAMGIYAKIVQSPAYRDAKLRTATDMLPDMLGPDARPFDLRFIGPDGGEWGSAHLLLVSNNPYQLDQLVGRGTRSRLDLGTLGVVAARIKGPAEAVAFIGLEAAGRVRSFSGWLEWNLGTFRVDSDGPIEIGIDGEAIRMDPPLLFASLPGRLRVRIPRNAPGAAPAARSVPLSGSTVGVLVTTALGREPERR
jgi:diacylglycerol kinase family enzyme